MYLEFLKIMTFIDYLREKHQDELKAYAIYDFASLWFF